jgi:poly(3-hydroxybutyrate) depolymerase
VNTNATLTHNGGGDSQVRQLVENGADEADLLCKGIASMITYAINNYGVNPNQVFVTGSSSGGKGFLSFFVAESTQDCSYDDQRDGWVLS